MYAFSGLKGATEVFRAKIRPETAVGMPGTEVRALFRLSWWWATSLCPISKRYTLSGAGASMEKRFVSENARELQRLRALVERLSDDELSLPLGTDWTISIALAHLAFWDQRSLVLMRKWKLTGFELSAIDIEVTNDALLPTWRALHPRVAANLAISAAQSIDIEIAESPSDLISEIERGEDERRLYRSIHRKMHLDQIEEALQKNGAPK